MNTSNLNPRRGRPAGSGRFGETPTKLARVPAPLTPAVIASLLESYEASYRFCLEEPPYKVGSERWKVAKAEREAAWESLDTSSPGMAQVLEMLGLPCRQMY